MMKRIYLILFLIVLLGLTQSVFCKEINPAEMINNSLNGSILSPLWGLPFLGMILSIALFPLLLPDFWKKHFGKVALAWSIVVLTGIAISQGTEMSIRTFLSVMIDQFLPFIFLLLTVFTVTGGITLEGEHDGTPKVNVILLIIGAILSSWLGTTGAAVLLIRMLIKANSWRKFKVHTIIFFIFIVGNIGGTLTPFGNPPLLMGFICKVPFFWPICKLLAPTAFTTFLLIVIYFLIDLFYYKKEPNKPDYRIKSRITIAGIWNIILLIFTIFAVVLSGYDFGTAFLIYHVPFPLGELLEILSLLAIIFVSVEITPKEIRALNNFTWHPIIEVGKLFMAIFICMAPLIAMLTAGKNGPMSFIIHSLSNANGKPVNGMYYWLSGGLSAFLDSAPAYLVFFKTAAAPAAALHMAPNLFMTSIIPTTLIAITVGASFMGAITYIGNAPNMIVKAIAEENNIKMPSFFGYMTWSLLILVPVFLVVQFLFIH